MSDSSSSDSEFFSSSSEGELPSSPVASPLVEETKKKSSKKKKSKKKDKKKKKEKGKEEKGKELKKFKSDSGRDLSSSKSKKAPSKRTLDPDLADGETDMRPKNPDGTPWKNPLKFWTNRPKQLNEIGAKCIMKPNPGTDIFCRTADSLTDNACFYWHKFDGDFNVVVKIKGQFKNSYDRAGIMLRQDERNWVLSGLEYFGGRLCLSTCVTRNITDWSLAPLADEKAAAENGIWIAMKRQEGRIACFYSTDLSEWIQTRLGPVELEDTLKVGIASTCPGPETYKVVFERFAIQAMDT